MQWTWAKAIATGCFAGIFFCLTAFALNHWLFTQQAQPASVMSTSYDIGGPFALTDQNGKPVTDANYTTKPKIVFFGFTSCPDVCPTTLAEIASILKQLGPDGDKITPLFISIDPERDTPGKMKEYTELFDKRIVGLTGTPTEVDAAARAFKVSYEKIKDGDSYSMNHTATQFLFTKGWKFIGTLDKEESLQNALPKLQKLLQ